MGLFHLVEQDNGIRLASDRLGELAALFISHIAGRRADQAGDRIFFHVFRHIDPHEIPLVVKQAFCQRLGEFRLAHAGRPQEQEGADGTVRILDARAGTQNGLGHPGDRLVLADHSLVQDILEMQELFFFALHQTGDRDAGPALDDPGDLLLRHLIPQQAVFSRRGAAFRQTFLLLQLLLQLGEPAVFELGSFIEIVFLLRPLHLAAYVLDLFPQGLHLADGGFLVLPFGLHGTELFPHFGKFLLDLGQVLLGKGVLFFFKRRLLNLMLDDLALDDVQFGRHGVDFGPDHGAGFVDEVDGFVGQEAVGDVSVRQGRGGDDGLVLDFDAVIHLVPFLEAAEDGDGVLHRRFLDQHGLEAPFECRILFNVLPVFVQRGGADAVELAPGQHGFEQVSRVHSALGLARTHDGVQLVDEQNDPAFRFADLFEHGFQPFFKFAAVFRPCDKGAHIKGENRLILQAVGHVPSHDPLRQPFGNGGFAHARLSDENGIVLGFAGENPDDVADLVVPADDRIHFLIPGPLNQIGPVFL